VVIPFVVLGRFCSEVVEVSRLAVRLYSTHVVLRPNLEVFGMFFKDYLQAPRSVCVHVCVCFLVCTDCCLMFMFIVMLAQLLKLHLDLRHHSTFFMSRHHPSAYTANWFSFFQFTFDGKVRYISADEEMEGPGSGDSSSAEPDFNDDEAGSFEDIDKVIDDSCNVLQVCCCPCEQKCGFQRFKCKESVAGRLHTCGSLPHFGPSYRGDLGQGPSWMFQSSSSTLQIGHMAAFPSATHTIYACCDGDGSDTTPC
jgi:hypothetical protein